VPFFFAEFKALANLVRRAIDWKFLFDLVGSAEQKTIQRDNYQ